VKSDSLGIGYEVREVENRGVVLFDNTNEAKAAIENLLLAGSEIFEDDAAFDKKYPPLGAEERKKRGMEFLEKLKQQNSKRSDNLNE
jgi:hypothetical protein